MTTCLYCAHHNRDAATFCANCGATLHAPLQALPNGSSLKNGEYTVQSMLGQGGFGITYVALQTTLGRTVVIKELCPQDAGRSGKTLRPSAAMHGNWAQNVAGFVQEAQTLARFNHPGIVRVQDVFQENNTAYFVMEHLQGQTLGEAIKKKPFTETQVQHLLEAITDALRVVHTANMLHRDIKPDNIFLEQSGRVVLLDFGSARGYQTGQTVAASRIITLGYSPLEQYAGKARFGPYTDIYALGGTLFTALTGSEPPDAAERVMGAKLEFPTGVASKWHQVIERAMALRIDDRPQSVDDFMKMDDGKLSLDSVLVSLPSFEKANVPIFAPRRSSKTILSTTKSTHVIYSIAKGGINSAIFSHDGSTILLSTENAEVTLLDSQNFKFIHHFTGHTGSVNCAIFSDDDRLVLTSGHDRSARLWSSERRCQLQQYVIHSRNPKLYFSSSGEGFFALGFDQSFRHYDLKHNETVIDKEPGHSFCVSDDKKRFFFIRTSDYPSLHTNGNHRCFLKPLFNSIMQPLEFTSDGSCIFTISLRTGLDNAVCLINLRDESVLSHYEGHTAIVTCITKSPDGKRILTGSSDHTARLWDINSGEEIRRLVGHTRSVSSVAFSPDGKTMLTGSLDGTIRLWT